MSDDDGGYFYLASAYSHHDPFVREQRFLTVLHAQVIFALEGHVVYSPVVHWHQAALIGALPKDAGFWEKHNRAMLSNSKGLWVLRMDGWEASQGIRWERQLAEKLGKAETLK